MDYIFRLTYGTDLRKGIEDYCANNGISSGCIVSCVGCVYKAKLRMAGGEIINEYDKDFEIVSLVGTISEDGVHMHISLSDVSGAVIGGHLVYGCLVNTTAEVVIRDLGYKYKLNREYDEKTLYNELVIKEDLK